MARAIRTPDASHPISVTPKPVRVRVEVDGEAVLAADTYLELAEASYPPVAYIPRPSPLPTTLVRSDKVSWCPYKGEAVYFHIQRPDGSMIEDAVWSYETPHGPMSVIKDHLAVYPNKVDDIAFG